MGLEVEKQDMMPDDLNANWPEGTDAIKFGDNHIRILKIVIKNVFKNLTDYKASVTQKFGDLFDGDKAKKALVADKASNSDKLEGNAASAFAKTSGTYPGLRAQATTKADVGLSRVPNFSITTSADVNSNSQFASASAVFKAARRGPGATTTVNAVGSYGFLRTALGKKTPGQTEAARWLYFTDTDADTNSGVMRPAGTWRCMGMAKNKTGTLWVRIS